MAKPAGGRGKKAPYKTTHVRVPEPLKPQVESLIEQFHNAYSGEDINLVTGLHEATVIAQAIIAQKKSARISLQKLLTALYGTDVQLK